VLTPIEEGSLLGTEHTDQHSIMCYQIPGKITKDGKPIIGGTDIDEQDFAFMAGVYPRKTAPGAPTMATNGLGTTDVTRLQELLAHARSERDILKKAIAIMGEPA